MESKDKNKRRRRIALNIVFLIVILIFAVAFADTLTNDSSSIQTTGKVKSVNVTIYETDGVTLLEMIDWGTLEPGESKNYSFVAKSEGKNADIVLYLSTDNWNTTEIQGMDPADASSYVSLTWDYIDMTPIRPDESLPLTFTLTVV